MALSLYEDLIYNGWIHATFPEKNIDRLAEKYKIVRYFHKPKTVISKRVLYKNGLCVFFDDFHIDILENGQTILTFGKRTSVDEIMSGLENIERQKLRELKLSRIIKKSKNVT